MISLAVARDADMADCLDIRRAVFIVEQDVDEDIEMDGCEDQCRHYIMRNGPRAIGTARMMSKGDTAKIQRVAIVKDHRGTGAGLALMRFILKDARAQKYDKALLGAQVYAIPFYERLGFKVFGPIYDDAGIDHRDMALALT